MMLHYIDRNRGYFFAFKRVDKAVFGIGVFPSDNRKSEIRVIREYIPFPYFFNTLHPSVIAIRKIIGFLGKCRRRSNENRR